MPRGSKLNTIITGEALEELKKLPDESVDCVITSPPYWGLRDYDHAEQLGLEPNFRDYIENLCLIFDQAKRVLKDTGTCWVNIGDTYNSGSPGSRDSAKWPKQSRNDSTPPNEISGDVSVKSLVQIPSRFALAMTDRGWILRNEIIWYKKNVMPSSVKDRFTVDFEKIFMFTKNKKYYFQQQLEKTLTQDTVIRDRDNTKLNNTPGRTKMNGLVHNNYEYRNKRTVWEINPQPFKDAHFAVFPPKLVETPIKSGCPEQVCKKCGKPRAPIYEDKGTNKKYTERGNPQGKKRSKMSWGKSHPNQNKDRFFSNQTVAGYTDCGCKAGWQGGGSARSVLRLRDNWPCSRETKPPVDWHRAQSRVREDSRKEIESAGSWYMILVRINVNA